MSRLVSSVPASAFVVVLFLSVYLLTLGGHCYTVDDEIYFRCGRSLAMRGACDIEPLEGDPQFAVARGRDGKWYPSKGPGFPLLVVPAVLAGRLLARLVPDDALPTYFLVPGASTDGILPVAPNREAYLQHLLITAINPLLTALTCGLFFDLCLRFGYGRSPALLLTGLYGLGTMAWIYASHSNFPEPLLALCTLGAFSGVFRFTREGRLRHVAAAGCWAGYALLTKVNTLLMFPVLLGYLTAQAVRRGLRARVAAPALLLLGSLAALSVLAALGYNSFRFGSPFETGYGVENSQHGLRFDFPGLLDNLLSLLFSWGKGLLFYATPAMFYPLAVGRFGRPHQLEYLTLGGLGLVYLLTAAAWYDWEGGLSWGPRFLLPAVALWMLPLGALLRRPGRRLRGTILLLCGLGCINQLAASSINWMEWYGTARQAAVDPNYAGEFDPLVRLPENYGELIDATANLCYFRLELSPMVGNWRVLRAGSWDLFWLSSPPEYRWHRGEALRLLVAACLALSGLFALGWLLRWCRSEDVQPDP